LGIKEIVANRSGYDALPMLLHEHVPTNKFDVWQLLLTRDPILPNFLFVTNLLFNEAPSLTRCQHFFWV